MKLIVDSGGTKAHWVLAGSEQQVKIATEGLHPFFMNSFEMSEVIKTSLIPKLRKQISENISPKEIYFYGAGCANEAQQIIVKTALLNFFPEAKIEVNGDLLGAARAVLGREEGIVGILGTGSNVGFYNGKQIVKGAFSLGYILGDEGSGAYLGKMLLKKYFLNELSQTSLSLFEQRYGENKRARLSPIYTSDYPNKYLATFAPFLKTNIEQEDLKQIITDGFTAFFDKMIPQVSEKKKKIAFVGSIAKVFEDSLTGVCNSKGMELKIVLKSPIEGLLNYHS
jgi:N-acetylglucosamine kinase-like BadF-type ATPase